jgi:hypothetical protein
MSTETIERTVDQATERSLIGRRNILAGIGGLSLAGAIRINRVFAQEATPTATDDEDGGETDVEPADADIEREIDEAYDNFVAKLAEQLGDTDAATVDTAIRNALKAMVDQEFDEGNISRNLATEIKERIDESEAPLATAMIGAMAIRGGGRGLPGFHGAGFPGGEVEVIPGGPDRTIMICAEGNEDMPDQP